MPWLTVRFKRPQVVGVEVDSREAVDLERARDLRAMFRRVQAGLRENRRSVRRARTILVLEGHTLVGELTLSQQ